MIDAKQTVEEYISKTDWRVTENSNAHYNYGALSKHLVARVSAEYWLEEVYNKKISDAHRNGYFHIHDLSALTVYCCGYSLADIIKKGVCGISNIPTSKPAKHFMSLLNQVANLITIYQNEIAGAVAFTSFDTLVAPFIKKDNLSYEEVKQYMQNFIFSINSNSRGGAEPAFSNLSFDLTPPKHLLDEFVVVGAEYLDYTYGDCQKEMDMLNRAFCEIMLEGDANGKPHSYPIPTYNIHDRFDWDNPNNEILWEMTGKYGTPYFTNYINSDMDPADAMSMAILSSQRVIYVNENGRVSVNEIRHLVNNWIKASDDRKPRYKILMNGTFVDIIDMFTVPYDKYPSYVQVNMMNGISQNFSMDHKCPVIRNGEYIEVKSQDLLVGDNFLISKKGFEADNIGDFDSGKILGYYLGEGWKHEKSALRFSININRKDIVEEISTFFRSFACEVIVEEQPEVSIYKVHVLGKQSVSFIEQYISGETAKTKRLSPKIWNTSLKFREGLVDGLYNTDGHKERKNLFHTTNKELCGDLVELCNSIGRITKYRVNDKNTRYFKEDKSDLETFTSYVLSFKEDYETIFLGDEEFALMPIKSLEFPNSKSDVVYNFTVDTPEHLYELPNGIITHQCCRLRIDLRELRKRGGGLFGSGEKTGSIGVVTINLPRLAHLSSQLYVEQESAKKHFYHLLEEYMNLAKDSLVVKRKFLLEQLERGLLPAFKEYVGTLDNHFSTIGLVGMNEMCINLLGCGIKSKAGHKFALEVLDFMREKIADYQEETGDLFNLEATPAESCLAGETKIKTVEYGDEEIKNLVGKEFGVWSYDADSKEVCIKRGHSVRKTQENTKVMELILDNGESLILTPSHPIAVNRPNRWGLPTINWVEARDLKPGNSIKSLYFTQAGENGYVMVNGAQKRANILSEWYEQRPIDSNEVVHHKDFDKTNDSIDNLERMLDSEHRALHADPSKLIIGSGEDNPFFGRKHSEETKIKISEAKTGRPFVLKNLTEEEFSEKMSKVAKSKSTEQHSKYRKDIDTNDIIKMRSDGATYREIAESFNCTTGLVQSRLKSVGLNHKVVSIREIDTLIDVYNMEVDDTECYFVDDNKGNGILVHNCAYRLAKVDVAEFGDKIYTKGNQDGQAPYYTNSCHLPVDEVEDIMQLVTHQEELQEKFTGGTVVHLYMDSSISGDTAKKIVRTVCERTRIPYVSISPVYSICPEHKFIHGYNPECPYCGKPTEQYQRITGYIRQISKFNVGKKAEFADRAQLSPRLNNAN